MKLNQIVFCSGLAILLSGHITSAQNSHIGSDLAALGNVLLAGQFVRAANDAVERGSLHEAEVNFRDALKASPLDERAMIGLSRCMALEGNLNASINCYQSLFHSHGEEYDIDLQTEYILVLAQADRGPEAVPLYNHVVDLCRKGRVTTPMEIVPPTFHSDGSDYDATRLQAMTHLIRAMNASTSDDKRITSEMQKAVALAPPSALLCFCEGVLLSRTNKSEAKKVFQQALSLDDGTNKKVISKWVASSK